ncbi:HemY protein [Novimethylophilus kurashikiensis]|uniref:HemY protein n=1 Tax=Novimethylophilus kurashikiensis TaxID=1825523 RepID=A0A2R5F6T4_9PROT|nr:heme biosynthesis protein HemY [Novimethylophilus kurashikiensis]GBG13956.1 HemY protein [Novimethylophilus kurashikiensis]
MKLLVWLLLVAGAAVAVPLLVGQGNGYVLLVQPPYRIELSTSLFLLLVVMTFFIVHSLLRLTSYTLQLPDKVKAFKRERRERDASAALMESLKALAEGRYGKAEKSAAQALSLGADPLVGTLVAARASHKLKNFERRDYYLAEAERLAPDAETARLLCQAELLLDQRRFSSALDTVGQLEKNEARHLPALHLELKARRQLGDWEEVLSLIHQLEKRGGIEPVIAQQWKLQAHLELLQRKSSDPALLLAYWQKLPEHDQLDSRIALAAARQFSAINDGAMAARIVEMSLTKQWDSLLAEYYGECDSPEPLKQLEQAEFWLKEHHNDAGLLLSLGKLCIRTELWGKAQSYLEASLSVQENSAAHLALAQIMEQLGHQNEANRHYRLSLQRKLEEHA